MAMQIKLIVFVVVVVVVAFFTYNREIIFYSVEESERDVYSSQQPSVCTSSSVQ